jgi:hypothetical protein
MVLYTLGVELWLLHNHAGLMLDDGYYYLKIAQSIAQGRGSTFDGAGLTNGYHPLWLLILVPVFWAAPGPASANFGAALLQMFFFAASVAMVYVTVRLDARRLTAVLAASVWVLFAYPYSLSGVEFSLHAFLVTTTAYYYLSRFARAQAPGPGSYLLLGALCSMTILARLDTLLLAASIGIFLLAREWQAGGTAGRFLRLTAFGLPVLFTCLAYAGANVLLFGHAVPVSGQVKLSWSEYLLSHDPIYSSQGWLAAKWDLLVAPLWSLFQVRHPSAAFFPLILAVGSFGVTALGLIGLSLAGTRYRESRIRRQVQRLGPFLLFSIMSYLSYVILFHAQLSFVPWYYVIQPWLAVMLISYLAELALPVQNSTGLSHLASGRLRQLALAAAVVLVCGIPLYTVRALWTSGTEGNLPSNYDPLFETAQWLKTNLPPDAVVGSWNAGMIGYFSGRRVFNLDGLANSWDFYARGQYDLCAYWERNGITYLADYFQGDRALSPIPSYPYYSRCADRLELVRAHGLPGPSRQLRVYRIRSPGQ